MAELYLSYYFAFPINQQKQVNYSELPEIANSHPHQAPQHAPTGFRPLP